MDQNRDSPGIGLALLLMLLTVAMIFGLTLPLAIVGALLRIRLAEHPVVAGCVNLVAFGAAIALGAFLAKAPLREVFPLRPVRKALALPLVPSVAGAVILLSEADNWTRSLLPPPEWLATFFADLMTGKTSFWGSLFLLATVAPVTEELFFRGLVLHGFLSRYSVRKSVLVSAALFALMHLNPWQSLSGAALGLLLGWWRVRTRSLWLCLAGHALANGLALSASFLPFHLRGFNSSAPLGETVEFQPLWLDLLGLALLVAGVWLFEMLSRQSGSDSGAPAQGAP